MWSNELIGDIAVTLYVTIVMTVVWQSFATLWAVLS